MSTHLNRERVHKLPEAEREAFFAWLREHGVEPQDCRSLSVDAVDVSTLGEASTALHHYLEAEMFVYDSEGRKQRHPVHKNEPLTEVRRVAIMSPSPVDLRALDVAA